MCGAQVDFADKNTVLMLEIWQTFVDLSVASGGPCISKTALPLFSNNVKFSKKDSGIILKFSPHF